MLYEEIEPFGERALYERSAALLVLLTNIYRKKDSTPALFEDFMPPTMRRPKQPQDERAERRAAFLAFAQAMGAKVKHGPDQ